MCHLPQYFPKIFHKLPFSAPSALHNVSLNVKLPLPPLAVGLPNSSPDTYQGYLMGGDLSRGGGFHLPTRGKKIFLRRFPRPHAEFFALYCIFKMFQS